MPRLGRNTMNCQGTFCGRHPGIRPQHNFLVFLELFLWPARASRWKPSHLCDGAMAEGRARNDERLETRAIAPVKRGARDYERKLTQRSRGRENSETRRACEPALKRRSNLFRSFSLGHGGPSLPRMNAGASTLGALSRGFPAIYRQSPIACWQWRNLALSSSAAAHFGSDRCLH